MCRLTALFQFQDLVPWKDKACSLLLTLAGESGIWEPATLGNEEVLVSADKTLLVTVIVSADISEDIPPTIPPTIHHTGAAANNRCLDRICNFCKEKTKKEEEIKSNR